MKKTLIFAVISVFSLLAIQPVGATVQYGALVKGSSPTVYFITSDNHRLAFNDEKTFRSWYPDFSSVVQIPDGTLGDIPFGGLAPLRPGIQPIKGATDNRVYAIDRDGKLRWLTSGPIASMIYGADWAGKLVVVSDTTLAAYGRGSDVTGPGQYWWKVERDASPNLTEVSYRMAAAKPPINADSGVVLASAVVTPPPPTRIIIIPTVINDNGGGGKEGDIKYFIDAEPVMPQAGNNVLPGTYTLYHEDFPGYTMSGWSGDCTADGVVTVPANETRACFITFDDIPDNLYGSRANRPPLLTLYSYVENRHGGHLQDQDVPLFIGSMQVMSGVESTINAADYTVYLGSLPAGYSASLWGGDCAPHEPKVGTVALRNGDQKVCTITIHD